MEYKNSPMRTSFKDAIIDQLAEEVGIPADVVNKVIKFQGEDILAHMKIVDEIEVSGWGKFFISKNKTKKKLKRDELILQRIKDKTERENLGDFYAPHIESTSKNIAYYSEVIERLEAKTK